MQTLADLQDVIRALSTLVVGTLICMLTGCAMCGAPYDCHYAAYGGKRPRADMINGRVGSAFQDAGVQMANYEGEEGAIIEEGYVDEGYVEDGYAEDGYVGEEYTNESNNDEAYDYGVTNDANEQDGSGTRSLPDSSPQTGDADSFSSPLEDQSPPDLLPENTDNPLRTNNPAVEPAAPNGSAPSTKSPQRFKDTLDAINELESLQQPRAGGADKPKPLDLEF